ncbi:MAG: hypothetical protein ACTSXX_06495 [Candidatus Baldrarchaeia archaeon]
MSAEDKIFDVLFTTMFISLFLFILFGAINAFFDGIAYKLMISFGSVTFLVFNVSCIVGVLEKFGFFDRDRSKCREETKTHEKIMHAGAVIGFLGVLMFPAIFGIIPIFYTLHLFGMPSPFSFVKDNLLWIVITPMLVMFAGFVIFCIGMAFEEQ